jgi:hypothetical protein
LCCYKSFKKTPKHALTIFLKLFQAFESRISAPLFTADAECSSLTQPLTVFTFNVYSVHFENSIVLAARAWQDLAWGKPRNGQNVLVLKSCQNCVLK